MTITEHGDPNGWFDPERYARRLAPEQLGALPAVIQKAEQATATGPIDVHLIRDRLVMIGARVQPGLGETAAAGWVTAIIDHLHHLPGDLIIKALDEARKQPFQFLNEVGPFLHTEVSANLQRRRAVLNRLRQIAASANAQAEASARMDAEDDMVMDPLERAEINAIMKRLNLRTRWDENGKHVELPTEDEERRQARARRGPPRKPTAEDYAEIIKEMAS